MVVVDRPKKTLVDGKHCPTNHSKMSYVDGQRNGAMGHFSVKDHLVERWRALMTFVQSLNVVLIVVGPLGQVEMLCGKEQYRI